MLINILFALTFLVSIVNLYLNFNISNIVSTMLLIVFEFTIIYNVLKKDKTQIANNSFYQVERSILLSKSTREMFQTLCESVVTEAGFKMCWVGFVDGATVKPSFYFGKGTQYAKTILISTDIQKEESKGITAKAILDNRLKICQDIQNSDITDPWKVKAKKYGLKSGVSLPIRRSGMAVGSFTIYSGKVDAFSGADIEVLTGLIEIIEKFFYIQDNLKLFEKLFDNNPNAIIITDKDTNIVKVNSQFTKISGYTFEDVYLKTPKMFQSGKHPKEFYQNMWQVINTDGVWYGEIFNKRKNGELFLESISIYNIKDEKGDTINYVSMFHDVSVIKDHIVKINFLENHDILTSAYNKNYIEENFDNIVKKSSKNSEELIVVFIDIDKFKHINDSLGYKCGDQILKQFSKRLQSVVKRDDVVCRLGNDEFLLLCSIKTTNNIQQICERLIENLTVPYSTDERDNIVITVSLGVSIYDINGRSFDKLLKFSDFAMCRSKSIGRNKFSIYDIGTVNLEMQKKIDIETHVVNAIKNNEFDMCYQPILNIETNKITSIEALIRWDSKELGKIGPYQFIPIVEEIGYGNEIGTFVFNRVFFEIKCIQKFFPSLRVNINVSLNQFRHKYFANNLVSTLKDHDIDPTCVCLEITEWVITHDVELTENTIIKLSELGIKIAIDDFGTGYSNLVYLHQWGINKIKIDKQFISNINTKYKSKVICQSIIDMAKKLQIEVIAEGVETKEQFETLVEMECSNIQGYYISRPLFKKDLIEFLNVN